MKFYTLLFCLVSGFFILPTVFAQENYIPAYVISSGGDSIHGFIDFRNWGRNPEYIEFRNELKDQEIVYKPLSIREFGVNGDIYVSAIVQTEISPGNSPLSNRADLKMQTDTAFLKAMIRGPKSLFSYVNKIGKEQFYIIQNSSMELLVYKKYIKTVNEENMVMENKRYIGQLSIYLENCEGMQEKLNRLNYEKNNMEKLFLAWYNCSNAKPGYHKKTEKVKLETGAMLGLAITMLDLHSDFYYVLDHTPFSTSYNVAAGFNFNVFLSPGRKRWSLNNELMLSSYAVHGTLLEYTNPQWYTETTTEFAFTCLRYNIMGRYYFSLGKEISGFANAGMMLGYMNTRTNLSTVTKKFYADYSVTESPALTEVSSLEQGYFLGVGAVYRRYSLDVRYEIGSGMSEYANLGSPTMRMYLLLGYRF